MADAVDDSASLINYGEIMEHPVFAPRNEDFDSERHLYHYTRWEVLPEISFCRCLRMSPFTSMNDPRESKDWLLGTSHQGRPDLVGIDQAAIIQEVADFKNRLKIVALSQDRPRPEYVHSYLGAGFAGPTMWAHYAGNHTGCCIIFDKEALDRRVLSESADLFGDPSGIIQGPISYTAEALGGDATFYGVDAGEVRLRGETSAVIRHLRRYEHEIWFQKHSDWSHEAEYRYVYYDPTERDAIYFDISDCVVGLVLGADFSESHLELARSFNDTFGLQGCIVQCSWNGAHWGPRQLQAIDGRWRFDRSPLAVAHTGISVAVSTQPPPVPDS